MFNTLNIYEINVYNYAPPNDVWILRIPELTPCYGTPLYRVYIPNYDI